MSDIKVKDIVELLEYTLQNRVISLDESLALWETVKILNKHDALVEENERLKQVFITPEEYSEFNHEQQIDYFQNLLHKTKTDMMKKYTETKARADKAEAEVEHWKKLYHLQQAEIVRAEEEIEMLKQENKSFYTAK